MSPQGPAGANLWAAITLVIVRLLRKIFHELAGLLRDMKNNIASPASGH
jgi:hypothetical protein